MARAIHKQQCADLGIRPELVHHYVPGEILAEGDTGPNRRRRIFVNFATSHPRSACLALTAWRW